MDKVQAEELRKRIIEEVRELDGAALFALQAFLAEMETGGKEGNSVGEQ